MKIDRLNLKFDRLQVTRAIFFTLTSLYLLSLIDTGLAIMAYEKSLGDSSPVQSWLNQDATSYSGSIFDTLLAIQEVSIAYRGALVDKDTQEAQTNLKEKVELLNGLLGMFEPATIVGQQVRTYDSASLALQTAKAFQDLVERSADNPSQTSKVAIFAAGEAASTAVRRMATEAMQREFQARDEMMLAIDSSRTLADKALMIGVILLIFGLLALISVNWAIKKVSR